MDQQIILVVRGETAEYTETFGHGALSISVERDWDFDATGVDVPFLTPSMDWALVTSGHLRWS